MKLLVSGLVVSVGLNAYQFQQNQTLARKTPATVVAAQTDTPPRPQKTAAADAVSWRESLDAEDLNGLVVRLTAAGFSKKAIRVLVTTLVNERFAPRERAIAGADVRPFWQQQAPLTPEQLRQLQALSEERNHQLESLLGSSFAELPVSEIQRRYGSISPDKIGQIERLRFDNMQQLHAAHESARAAGNADYRALRDAFEAEFRTDLEMLLTPQELRDYDLRNSRSAQQVISGIRGIEVNEAEYLALYDAQENFDRTFPDVPDSRNALKKAETRNAMHDDFRAILGDERFFSGPGRSLTGDTNAIQFIAANGLPRETGFEMSKLFNYSTAAFIAIQANHGQDAAAWTREVAKLREETYARLNAILGPENAEAYKARPGRWLSQLNATSYPYSR